MFQVTVASLMFYFVIDQYVNCMQYIVLYTTSYNLLIRRIWIATIQISLSQPHYEGNYEAVFFTHTKLEYKIVMWQFSNYIPISDKVKEPPQTRGRILGRNWGKSCNSFPPCYSQLPLLTYGNPPPPPPPSKVG